MKKAFGGRSLMTLLTMVAVVLISGACSSVSSDFVDDYESTPVEADGVMQVIDCSSPSPALQSNNKQFLSYTWVGTYNNQIMFVQDVVSVFRTSYAGWLCTVDESGNIQRRHFIASDGVNIGFTILGNCGKYLYYAIHESARLPNDDADKLYCLNLETYEEKLLYQSKDTSPSYKYCEVFYADDGSVYFPLILLEGDSLSKIYLHVLNDRVLGITSQKGIYKYNNCIYYTRPSRYGEVEEYGDGFDSELHTMEIISEDESGNKSSIPCEASNVQGRQIIPTDYGLIVHDSYVLTLRYNDTATPLYLGRTDGTIVPLFVVDDCSATLSTATVIDNYVYLSVAIEGEYKSQKDVIGVLPETAEGTYRIDLRDLSCEKISDMVFQGMYVLDDDHIYASLLNGNIYKLDYDGNVVETVLEKTTLQLRLFIIVYELLYKLNGELAYYFTIFIIGL